MSWTYIHLFRIKNIPDIFDCNLKKDYQIYIIFDTNISDTTGDQMTVQFSTAPICLLLHYLGKQQPMKYCIFILYYYAFSGFLS